MCHNRVLFGVWHNSTASIITSISSSSVNLDATLCFWIFSLSFSVRHHFASASGTQSVHNLRLLSFFCPSRSTLPEGWKWPPPPFHCSTATSKFDWHLLRLLLLPLRRAAPCYSKALLVSPQFLFYFYFLLVSLCSREPAVPAAADNMQQPLQQQRPLQRKSSELGATTDRAELQHNDSSRKESGESRMQNPKCRHFLSQCHCPPLVLHHHHSTLVPFSAFVSALFLSSFSLQLLSGRCHHKHTPQHPFISLPPSLLGIKTLFCFLFLPHFFSVWQCRQQCSQCCCRLSV